jgi:hypothetical protein
MFPHAPDEFGHRTEVVAERVPSNARIARPLRTHRFAKTTGGEAPGSNIGEVRRTEPAETAREAF